MGQQTDRPSECAEDVGSIGRLSSTFLEHFKPPRMSTRERNGRDVRPGDSRVLFELTEIRSKVILPHLISPDQC